MLLLAVGVTLAWLVARRRTAAPLALAALAALIVMYVGIGVVRADLASDFTERSRYVYVAAFFMVLLAADLLAGLFLHIQAKRVAIFVMAPLLVLSITANAADLQAGRGQFQLYADLTRSYVTIIDKSQDQSWMDPAGTLAGWPTVDDVRALVNRYGSLATDEFLPSVATRPSDAAYEQATLRLVGRGFRVDRGSPPSPKELQLRVLAIDGAEPTPIGACLTVAPNGSNPSVTVQAPGGTWIQVSGGSGAGGALLGHKLRPWAGTRIPLALTKVQPTYVRIPDIGDGSTWQVTVELPGGNEPVSLCSIEIAPAAGSASP
jgi:hypothetical protein